jgi:uncharacterized protein YbaR (Trm112 family)
MQCEEIQERFIDILYAESGTATSDREIKEHILACPECRRTLEQLQHTRKVLALWKDESPLRSIEIPSPVSKTVAWRYLRYAAIAAMVVMSFLAVTNMQISWNKNGFSLSTRLLPEKGTPRDYYTKAELRDFVKRSLDDSESRINETNYMMMQKLLDTLERDRWNDLRLIRGRADRAN